LRVVKRRFYSQVIHTYLTSNEPLCSHCLTLYKNIKSPKLLGKASRDIIKGEDIYESDITNE